VLCTGRRPGWFALEEQWLWAGAAFLGLLVLWLALEVADRIRLIADQSAERAAAKEELKRRPVESRLRYFLRQFVDNFFRDGDAPAGMGSDDVGRIDQRSCSASAFQLVSLPRPARRPTMRPRASTATTCGWYSAPILRACSRRGSRSCGQSQPYLLTNPRASSSELATLIPRYASSGCSFLNSA
jgi:hypothetical protein